MKAGREAEAEEKEEAEAVSAASACSRRTDSRAWWISSRSSSAFATVSIS